MAKKFVSVEEITDAFIKKGWSKTVSFTEVTLKVAEEGGLDWLSYRIERGQRFFRMSNGNIFNEYGKVVFFNVSASAGKNYNNILY